MYLVENIVVLYFLISEHIFPLIKIIEPIKFNYYLCPTVVDKEEDNYKLMKRTRELCNVQACLGEKLAKRITKDIYIYIVLYHSNKFGIKYHDITTRLG